MILFTQQVAAQINKDGCLIVQQVAAQCIQKLSVLFSISQQVAGHLAWLFCSIVQASPAQFTQSFSQQTVDQFISLFTQHLVALLKVESLCAARYCTIKPNLRKRCLRNFILTKRKGA